MGSCRKEGLFGFSGGYLEFCRRSVFILFFFGFFSNVIRDKLVSYKFVLVFICISVDVVVFREYFDVINDIRVGVGGSEGVNVKF